MAYLTVRAGVRRTVGRLTPAALAASVAMALQAPHAGADAVAYLVNVTVRPGYNFTGAEHALTYGRGICDKVGAGRTYSQIMSDVKSDVNTADEYQASYLISQAVNELCPALIWELRNTAAGYQAPGP
jgi:Protein of unknown function (DUF732)